MFLGEESGPGRAKARIWSGRRQKGGSEASPGQEWCQAVPEKAPRVPAHGQHTGPHTPQVRFLLSPKSRGLSRTTESFTAAYKKNMSCLERINRFPSRIREPIVLT